jgi:hypothetical protein
MCFSISAPRACRQSCVTGDPGPHPAADRFRTASRQHKRAPEPEHGLNPRERRGPRRVCPDCEGRIGDLKRPSREMLGTVGIRQKLALPIPFLHDGSVPR